MINKAVVGSGREGGCGIAWDTRCSGCTITAVLLSVYSHFRQFWGGCASDAARTKLLSISARPGSAALLPVSTTSTGLLHLSVGAHVHRVRSDTEKYHVWPLLRAHHFQCMTYTCQWMTYQKKKKKNQKVKNLKANLSKRSIPH